MSEPSQSPSPPSDESAKTSVRDLSRADSRELLAVKWMQSQAALNAFLLASLPQFSDAEDLLQEVAAEVARRFDDYDPTRPFLPWAIWVAKLKIADFYRVRQRQPVRFVGESIDALALACDRIQNTLTEERVALDQCLSGLQGRARQLVELRYFNDQSPQEIGEAVGMTSGAVRIALSRIRSALADCVRTRLNVQSPL